MSPENKKNPRRWPILFGISVEILFFFFVFLSGFLLDWILVQVVK